LRLKAILREWMEDGAAQPERLLAGLREDAPPPASDQPIAPSDVPQEATLSAIFIRNPVYGTRCSTVAAVDHAGRGLIVERRYDADGRATGETALSFAWPG